MKDIDKTIDFQSSGESPRTGDRGSDLPSIIGRYRIDRVLGEGGFGIVYLGYDGQLQRPVAIKVPHRKLVDRPETAEAYLSEARTVANLDHPNIVPVHDVGSTESFPVYIVSKYVDGTDLATRLKQTHFTLSDAVELIATVAEALHSAHKQGLVHRDIKPSNLLLDKKGKPFIADFGLALREQDLGKGPRYAGTPAYMSPEQARGEGHRVDGRSDIFSLGIVLYELLAGRHPFRGDSQEELLEQVVTHEPRPLRQLDESVPRELERICFKSLSKRVSERYMTAKDFADDLRQFMMVKGSTVIPTTDVASYVPSVGSTEGNPAKVSGQPRPAVDLLPVRIVPKGLRSFDSHDASFFLDLLPGPRDRDGLPDVLRFWKVRLEEMDSDSTFSVGLIYGPSGCGKTSMVRAGLLPRLSNDVISVYVEATGDDTEARLLNGIRKRCPALPDDMNLKATLTALRRGQGLPVGKKVVLILDQFEQWLHTKKLDATPVLVEALRQCDGGHLQCIVMVRDDFWMAASRFMRALEIRLADGQNSAAIDLFDMDHAKKVLAAFGRAFGKLPENAADTTKDQQAFLKQSVEGLAQEGKVVSVRLSLFAEMMKGRPWTEASLNAMGGAEGVGITFLEETFSSSTAPPDHRYHQKAARADLAILLPETGSDIKGHMRSYAELLEASGYGNRPKDFDDLLRILDNEVRLITPTDPEGKDFSDSIAPQSSSSQKYYQLTHDYLVHSMREWLTRKQKETRKGRAELLLADLAAIWNSRPENRQLPSLLQWLSIRWFVAKKSWTHSQRKMMAKAGGYHVTRCLVLGFFLAVIGVALREGLAWNEARILHDQLLVSTIEEAPSIIKDMAENRRWINPLLRESHAQSEETKDSRKQLQTALALLPVDPHFVEFLHQRLLEGEPEEVVVIREVLIPHKSELSSKLWATLENRESEKQRRLRAASALAVFEPDNPRWKGVASDLVSIVIREKPFQVSEWVTALNGVGKFLLPPLADFLLDGNRSATERSLLANIYSVYASQVPKASAELEHKLEDSPNPNSTPESRLALAKNKADIAIALLLLGRDERVWPLLSLGENATLRTLLIHRLSSSNVDPQLLVTRLSVEKEPSIKHALLMSLCEFRLEQFDYSERVKFTPVLLDYYRNDPDPAIHSASELLLRRWQKSDEIEKLEIEMADGKIHDNRKWYINSQRQTMVIVPKPGDVLIGDGQHRHPRVIDRTFAIASKEVTVEQFAKFSTDLRGLQKPAGTLPIRFVSWYEAVAYCNWLSEKDGIPKEEWCYIPNQEGKYEDGMTFAPDLLNRSGYRLPVESEWEFACQGRMSTNYFFGDAPELLSRYAWYESNSFNEPHPVGLLLPNDLGLFDMHGNTWEWCQNVLNGYVLGKVKPIDADVDQGIELELTKTRELRGGSYVSQPFYSRTYSLFHGENKYFDDHSGFRVVRTIKE